MEPRRPPAPELPAGGGIAPGGETLAGGGYAGAAAFTLPIRVPEARGFEPELALEYASGAPNGPFGLGFRLALPSVSRAVQLRTPSYTLADTFVCDEGLLVRLAELDRVEDGRRVLRYAPRDESAFSQIEQYVDESTGDAYWRVVDRDDTTTFYGRTPAARIADPRDPARVYSWLIEESCDRHGNVIAYAYKPEDTAGVPPSAGEDHRGGVQLYPKTISYGVCSGADELEQRFTLRIVFDYGEQTSADGVWPARLDPFSNYQPRFELRTRRLCRAVLVYHDFPEQLGAPATLVWALRLTYHERAEGSTLAGAVEVGYADNANGGAAEERLPPTTFEYTPFDAGDATFAPLRVAPAPLGTQLSSELVQFVDLDGQGLPSLLYSDEATTLIWEPQGDGTYLGPVVAPQFPAQRNLENPAYAIADLDADGRLDLVVGDGQAGSYPYAGAGAWGTFRAFASTPTTLGSPALQSVELHGNGRADRAQFTPQSATVYASQGTDGFAAPVARLLPAGFPPGPEQSAQEALRFANVFGDGLAHRVRIGSGYVDCWPNLGDGTFGERVRFANAPSFGGTFEAGRLFVADLTGNGFDDLVYAGADRVSVYFNRSGNSFSDPLSVTLPQPFDQSAALRFADVRGTGVTAAVLIATDPAIGGWFLDFRLDQRPDLLSGYDNHRGLSTRLRYASSTQFYLADRRAGAAWPTRMYFPVPVVEKIETWDAIARAKTAQRFAYHDGNYDSYDREFRGFGYVEHWDSESFEDFMAADLHPQARHAAAEPALFTAPAYTRSWYHTGSYAAQAAVALQFAQQYWQGDPDALRLPDSVVEAGPSPDARTLIQGTAALAGRLLREEVYGLEGGAADGVPYTVTEHDYTARLVYPPDPHRYAVFAVFPRESATSVYDRVANDPRIEHDAVLDVDAYGNTTGAVTIAYGRRPVAARVPEQVPFRATSERSAFVDITDGGNLLGLPASRRGFALLGLDLQGRTYFTYAMLRDQVPQAERGETPSRLLSWEVTYYWNLDQTAPLPEGQATLRGLRHHLAAAVFSDAQVQAVFNADGTTRVTAHDLEQDGGYVLDRAYWWNPGDVWSYGGASTYFTVRSATDPFGAVTAYGYDAYDLLVTSVTDPLGNSVAIANDYRVLLPAKIVDVNDVTSEALFSPLGYLTAHSIYGTTEGKPDGDLPLSEYAVRAPASMAAVIEDPHYYLQGATTFYLYDLASWDGRGEPLHSLEVQRTLHVSALGPGERSPVRLHAVYLDGEGRTVQEQLQVPLDVGTEPVDPAVTQLWQATGTIRYDNKGRTVREYQPFFAPFASAADVRYAPATGIPAQTNRYDALSREIETVEPNGFFRRTRYGGWSQWDYDEDDTVAESPMYRDQICNTDPAFAAQRDALIKAVAFADTPTESVLDPSDNVCRTVEINVAVTKVEDRCGSVPPGEDPIRVTRTLVPLTTYRTFDESAFVVALTDPRLASWNEQHGTDYRNFRYARALDGEALFTASADAGPLWALADTSGNPIRSWDGRGTATVRAYDVLGRLTSVTVTAQAPGGPVTAVVDAVTYGTDRAKNQNERPLENRDTAGVAEFLLYDVEGQPLAVRRTLLAAPVAVDWRAASAVALETGGYVQSFAYDALQRVIAVTNADGSSERRAYYSPGWIASVGDFAPDGTALAAAPLHRYDANGQRVLVGLANGTETSYAYDPATLRLAGLRTVRTSDARVFQQIAYTYDPVGNVTRVADDSLSLAVPGAPSAPFEYTYDALYQLIGATGREAVPGTPQTYASFAEAYAYDAGRNLTGVAHAGATTWLREFVVAENSDRAVPSGMLPGAGTPDDFYDGDGNLTAYESLRALAWDYRNALVAADAGPAGAEVRESYVYSAAGRRLRKVLASTAGGAAAETSRTYAGNLIVFATGTVPQRTVVRLGDDDGTLVALSTAESPDTPALRYQYANNVSSVVLELDGAAELVSYEEFAPYGTSVLAIAPQPAWLATKIYRYGGKEHDDATSFAYYGARYYSGSFGRWPSTDPAGPQGNDLDLYDFVRNNPVSTVDVGGLMAKSTAGKKKKAKQKFDVKIVNRKAALGMKLKITGRPKKFTTYTLKAVSKNFPTFHKKGTTKLVGNNKYSRNHEFPWFGTSKELRTQTRGMQTSDMETYVKSVDTSKFHQKRYKNQLAKIQKGTGMSNATLEKAFAIILLERYNDPENLYIGSSSVNSSGGSSMKQSHVRLQNNHNGSAPLAPAQVVPEQQKFRTSSIDARPGSSAQYQSDLEARFKQTWGATPGKYV